MIKTHILKGCYRTENSFYKTIHMKKIFFWLGFNLFVSAAFGQLEQTPTATAGLMSRLLEIKYGSESYLGMALKKESNKETNKDTSKDTAIAIYNTLRWKIDALVYTLSSDMIAANSPRTLKLLNDWCLEQATPIQNGYAKNEKIKVYTQMLYEIDALYTQAIINNNAAQRTLNLTTNVFYLLKDSYTIVKGLSDMKKQKTMALIELLDHTRLLSVGEIGKGVK